MTAEPDSASEATTGRELPAWAWFLLACVFPGVLLFWDVLVHDRNFIYRDAGHFYYPYFKRIAQEWGAGRLPLWNPWENCGEPLAAQPTASVWYPGKLVFLLPYPLAYKTYLLGHWVFAWIACFLAARGFGLCRAASAAAAIGYAGSSFVIFQLYNIVFLVGAAWLPLGLLMVDRVVRTPTRRAASGLAAVVAMQILGGDPEAGMLLLMAAVPYALLLHLGGRGAFVGVALLCCGHGIVRLSTWWPALEYSTEAMIDPTLGERVATFVDAVERMPGRIAKAATEHFRPWYAWTGVVAPAIGLLLLLARRSWAAAGWRNRSLRFIFFAAALSAALAAIQILPTQELVKVSDRSAPEAPRASAAFSLFPVRLLEMIFPAVFGRQMPEHTRWAPFTRWENSLWTPVLYSGLATVLLAAAAFRWRRAPVQVVALSWLVIVALWMAIGKYGGAYWFFDPNCGTRINLVSAPPDTNKYGPSDGLYRLAEEAVPVFASFRYPEKLFVLVALGLALLAGVGLQQLLLSDPRRLRKAATFIAAFGVVALLVLFAGRGWIEAWIAGLNTAPSSWGKLVPADAWRTIVESFLRATAAGGMLVLALRGPVAHRGVLVVACLAVDVGLANRWLVLTDEQSAIDAKPKVVQVIEEAEAKENSGAAAPPFRIHRTAVYEPLRWLNQGAADRTQEMTRWERNTIQPKYGLPWGMHYAHTIGTMSIYDTEFFFAPWTVAVPGAWKQSAGRRLPDRMTYYPRVGYNLWNVKYFVLPDLQPLDDDERGVFTLTQAKSGGRLPELAKSAGDKDDFVVIRNPEAYPRAWVVHAADFKTPVVGLRRADRKEMMEQIVYRSEDGGAPLWPGRNEYPSRSTAMLETASPQKIAPFLSQARPAESENVRFSVYEPQRVVMEATLESPGLLVLADTFFAGWAATIDGKATPIVKANRVMRAVPLTAGPHRIEMTYRCTSLWQGAFVSLAAWLLLVWWRMRDRRSAAV